MILEETGELFSQLSEAGYEPRICATHGDIMEAIIERTSRRVTVSMSTRRWNRIQKLEQAYKLASTIKRSMKQAETAPAMTVEQAMRHLEEL